MYPPAAGYIELATDPERPNVPSPSTTQGRYIGPFHYPRQAVIIRCLCAVVTIAFTWRIGYVLTRGTPVKVFNFDQDGRPAWLDVAHPDAPTRLRVAVISRDQEFGTREVLRESVFQGVRQSEVELVFRFFVGVPSGFFRWWTSRRLEREMKEYGDIVYLRDITDVKERISEKRFAVIKWAGSVPRRDYDWFMTMDSDTFVRFEALSKRMSLLQKQRDVNPQNQSVLVGRMATHCTYWENGTPDGSDEGTFEEDPVLRGPWFDYPIGIGYLLSPFLVETLLSLDPPPPHHIHYPSDDVMIGAWVAALKHFPDTSLHFETTPGHAPEPVHKVIPRPYLLHPIDTIVINDKEGWHDYPVRKNSYESLFSWSSVCVHHVRAEEMRMLRGMDAISGEWI